MKYLFLFVFIVLFFSCKKNEKPVEPIQTGSLQLEKSSYNPLEVATATISDPLSLATYKGQVGSTEMTIKNDNGTLLFFVPDIAPGTYTVKMTINNKEYSSAISISNFTTPDPGITFNNMKAHNDSLILKIRNYADSTSMPAVDRIKYLNDVQQMQTWMNSVYTEYAALSAADKQSFTRLLAANETSLGELDIAVNNLFEKSYGLRVTNEVEDHDRKVTEAMQEFTAAVIRVRITIAKVAVVIGASAVLGSALGPLGAIGGAALGWKLAQLRFGAHLTQVVIAMEKLLTVALEPFNNLIANRVTAMEFTNNTSRRLNVTMNYRTLYNADKTSSNQFVSGFINSLYQIRDAWNKMISFLPGPLQYAPKVIDDYTNYTTKTREIHSNYLSITDVTNTSNVSFSYTKSDGYIDAKASTTQASTQNFNFKLNYNSTNFGNFSSTISATVQIATDSTDIYKANMVGNWVVETHNNINTSGWDITVKQYKTFNASGEVFIYQEQYYNPPPGPNPPLSVYNPPVLQEHWTIVHKPDGYHLKIIGSTQTIETLNPLTYPIGSFWFGNPPTTGGGGVYYTR